MVHVTANEAGRNAVFKDRLFRGLYFLINAIKNNTASKKEIIAGLVIIMFFVNTRLKTQITGR